MLTLLADFTIQNVMLGAALIGIVASVLSPEGRGKPVAHSVLHLSLGGEVGAQRRVREPSPFSKSSTEHRH
jgi:hypothetical protein